MKKLVLFSLLASLPVIAAEFIHPMDFKNTSAEKSQVIEYIKQKVHKDYCQSDVDMCDNITLRAMENENLNAFKKATQATNRSVMDRVIKDYCESDVDMCDYVTIYMMYKENEEAGAQELQW